MKAQELPLARDPTDKEINYPAKTIATILNITDRRLRQLAAEGIVPKATRGKYPLVGCVQAYINYVKTLNVDAQERNSEKARLTRARADNYELEVAQKRGAVYPRDLVDEVLFNVATDFTAMLDATATRVAGKVGGGAKTRNLLLAEFRDIRNQLARGLRRYSESLRRDGWHRGAAARSKSRAVGKKVPRSAKRKR